MSFYVEIPAVYVDDLQFIQEASAFTLINRIPEPNETDVPSYGTILFTAINTDATGIAPLDIDVFVDGLQAVDSGTFINGYTGISNQIDADTVDFEILSPILFTSLQVVEVQVVHAANPLLLDVTYEFTAEDLTSPSIENVIPQDQTVIRIFFNEEMNPDIAEQLNPANYVIERRDADLNNCPAVLPTVIAVNILEGGETELITDIEMTPNGPYTVRISNLTDASDNPIVAPFDAFDFLGFVPDIPAGREFNLYRFLPQKNRDEDVTQDLLRFVKCLQEVGDLLLTSIDRWTRILDPDLAPELFVDAMLCDLGNPFNFELDSIQKRKLSQILVEIYKLKGTAVGIINVIRFFLGIEVIITDPEGEGWPLGEGELGGSGLGEEGSAILGSSIQSLIYSFVVVSPVTLTLEEEIILNDVVDFMKPGHTHHIETVQP